MRNIIPINEMTISLSESFSKGNRFETKDAFVRNLLKYNKKPYDVYEIRMHRHLNNEACITINEDKSFPTGAVRKTKVIEEKIAPKTHNVLLECKCNRIEKWVKIKSDASGDVKPLIKMIDYLGLHKDKEVTPYYKCKLSVAHNRGYISEASEDKDENV